MQNFQLKAEQSLLLIVDVQERLLPAVQSDKADVLVSNLSILMQAAVLFNVPTVVTEQYPKGLGHTIEPLQPFLGTQGCWEKTAFSCMQDPAIEEHIKTHTRTHVVLCGIETHVCVLQTALDLLTKGYHVHVMNDAVGSRTEDNRQTGLAMIQEAGGIISSTETAVFQWAGDSKHTEFKALSRLVR